MLWNRKRRNSARTKGEYESSRSRCSRTKELKRCHFRSGCVDVAQSEHTAVMRQEAAPVLKDGMTMAVIVIVIAVDTRSIVPGRRHCAVLPFSSS